MREDEVRRLVRRVVYRTLGRPSPTSARPAKRIVSESDVSAVERGGSLQVPTGALLTPLARQVAIERDVELRQDRSADSTERNGSNPSSNPRVVAIGADHGGYELKETLKRSLTDWGYAIVDCGTSSADSVDYPDYAFAVAQQVASGSAWRGVMIDGAGIGSCMTANKVPGVLASMCYDQATAINSREHNNANLLTLGAGLIGAGLARSILKTWLETPFGGGRHGKRVDKITDIENRFLRSSVAAKA